MPHSHRRPRVHDMPNNTTHTRSPSTRQRMTHSADSHRRPRVREQPSSTTRTRSPSTRERMTHSTDLSHRRPRAHEMPSSTTHTRSPSMRGMHVHHWCPQPRKKSTRRTLSRATKQRCLRTDTTHRRDPTRTAHSCARHMPRTMSTTARTARHEHTPDRQPHSHSHRSMHAQRTRSPMHSHPQTHTRTRLPQRALLMSSLLHTLHTHHRHHHARHAVMMHAHHHCSSARVQCTHRLRRHVYAMQLHTHASCCCHTVVVAALMRDVRRAYATLDAHTGHHHHRCVRV